MPELPEVETIRRDLTPRIVGRTIVEAWVSPNAPKLVQAVPAGRQGEPAEPVRADEDHGHADTGRDGGGPARR